MIPFDMIHIVIVLLIIRYVTPGTFSNHFTSQIFYFELPEIVKFLLHALLGLRNENLFEKRDILWRIEDLILVRTDTT